MRSITKRLFFLFTVTAGNSRGIIMASAQGLLVNPNV